MKLDTIVNQPVVETERLLLRPLRRSDHGLLEMYSSDERVARMTRSIPHPLPPGATEAFVQRALAEDRNEDVWVMDASRNNRAELVGLLFDGTFESVNSDWDFDPRTTRTIHVDTRYMLWVMDKVDGAEGLIEEMDVVE